MANIEPTVGRMVYFYPDGGFPSNGSTVLPAVIVRVWSPDCVNLKVLNDGEKDFWVTSVMKGSSPRNWDWMPFQKDQAARLAPGTPIAQPDGRPDLIKE